MRQYRMMVILLGWLVGIGWLFPGMLYAQDNPNKPKMVDFWQPGESGQRMRIRGRVTSFDGRPIPNVEVNIRHADSEGMDWSY